MPIRLDEWRRRKSRLAARYPSGARGPRAARRTRFSRGAWGYGVPVVAIAFFLVIASAPVDLWPRSAPPPEAIRGTEPGAAIGGRAAIIDGDTLAIRGQRIRLEGIDAPESAQRCDGPRGRYACGREATRALGAFIGGDTVECSANGRDRYGRMLAVCTVNGRDIGAAMVLAGWALAGRGDYIALEREARAAARGVWQGKFQPPADWRREHKN